MNIGIDIDGVLTNMRKFEIEEGIKYCEKTKIGGLVNSDAYSSTDMFNWDEETDFDFWKENIFKYAETGEVMEGAANNTKKLKEDGHKLYIITARWLANDEENAITKNNNEIREKMRETVKGWLRKNNIEYDKIIFSGEDKSKHIIENKIDIMIEDSPNNLKQLSKLTKMICMDWNYNKEVDGEKIYRCYNWDEIYSYITNVEK